MNKLIFLLAFSLVSTFCYSDEIKANTLSSWIVSNYSKNISVDKAHQISKHLVKVSEEMKLELDFLVGLISKESGFKTTAVSREGAEGLMQVMAKFHRTKLKGRSLRDPKVSIDVGTIVLKDCLDDHNQNKRKALACYSGSSLKTVNPYYTKVMAMAKEYRDYARKINSDRAHAERMIVAYSTKDY